MIEASLGSAARISRSSRSVLGVTLRSTEAGAYRHHDASDHQISVHAGPDVRVSCHATQQRAVRTRGNIELLPAGSSESWTDDDPSRAVELKLPDSLLRLAAQEMGLNPDRVELVAHYHLRDPQIENIAWALEADSRAAVSSGALYRESMGLALALHLLVRCPLRERLRERATLPVARLERVRSYIDAHLHQDVSLTQLARVGGVSASHFKTLFKRATGLSVHAYVLRRRVEHARLLLASAELPAAQIAQQVGFAHQSHMARVMRRVLGVSPREIARI